MKRQPAQRAVGTAKGALIISGRGIITTIHTSTIDHRKSAAVEFIGGATVSQEVSLHANDTILDIVRRICAATGIETPAFEIAIENAEAAAVHALTIEVSGFSADAAILASMLSACLRLPICQDTIFTGRVSTCDGYLSPVEGLPQKIVAAMDTQGIKRFVYPQIGKDGSLDALAPEEAEGIRKALLRAKDRVDCTPIGDICDLVKFAASEEDICLASLDLDFFSRDEPIRGRGSPMEMLENHLLRGNESRFWKFLERFLLDERLDEGRRLLESYVNHHGRQSIYPEGFGQRLWQLIISIPPRTRRKPAFEDLFSVQDYVKLAQLAMTENYPDLRQLNAVTLGTYSPPSSQDIEPGAIARPQPRSLLNHFASALSPETIAKEILSPIDNARASYSLSRITVESYPEYLDSISAFYAHMERYRGRITGSVNLNQLSAEAIDLVGKAFADSGGEKAAYSDALSGVNGGLRYVFDMMTQQLKADEQRKYVAMVFKTMIDPLDYESKTEVIREMMQMLGPDLPDDIRSQPPERFASRCHVIIEAYTKSLEKLVKTLRLL